MTESDLARFELAKRAYQAAQPTEREVQTGVRRARLSLERRKPRRNWFSKGVVMVVLAVGGLAYAKPQAARDMLARVTNATAADHGHALLGGVGRGSEPPLSEPPLNEPSQRKRSAANAEPTAISSSRVDAPSPPPSPVEASESERWAAQLDSSARVDAARSEKRALSPAAPRRPTTSAPTTTTPSTDRALADASSKAAKPVTEWGRVGEALAEGDERRALNALSELAESDDPRTRDKADLGRAQLLMAHGNADKACAIAQSLTNRRAGSRIERQAHVLLKSCR